MMGCAKRVNPRKASGLAGDLRWIGGCLLITALLAVGLLGLLYSAPGSGPTAEVISAMNAAFRAPSFLTDDPEACVNCHLMRSAYLTWRHSSHAEVAHCND